MSNWTPPVINRFSKLMQDASLAFSDIANRLSAEFGVPFTRNAVIGRAERNNMVRPKLRLRPQRRKKTAVQIARTKPPRNVREALPSGAYLLEELGPGDCRWPTGDRSPFTFCGAAVVEDKPYCLHHAQMAYQNWQRRL
jgi:GcrA cell cycle regulator